MVPKSPSISIPLIVMAGALAACAPREEAVEQGPAGDTLAADAAAPPANVDAAAADSVPTELLGTRWRLAEFNTGEAVPEGIEITAEFRQGGIAGRSACNRYTGPVAIDLGAGRIQFGALVSTKMACPAPQMESETRYLGALERASGVSLEPGRLTIQSADGAGGTSTLLFVPAEDA
jgi:heat shock protein HslJ